jgi:hypothetical protein
MPAHHIFFSLLRANAGKAEVAMKIRITDTILKRLVNYETVMRQKLQAAEKRQWIDMTLHNMQEYATIKARSQTAFATAGYGLYLYKVQKGLRKAASVYGEPLLHNSLLKLLEEWHVPVRFVECPDEAEEGCGQRWSGVADACSVTTV